MNRSSQFSFENSAGSRLRQNSDRTAGDTDTPAQVKNLKYLLAGIFQRMVDNKSTKDKTLIYELLKDNQAPPFESFDYLRKAPGSGRNYTILEMLQHPCLLFPAFIEGLSMKDVLTQVSDAFPYNNMPRRISNKDALRLYRRDIETAKCPRVEGNEVHQMEFHRVTKSIWSYYYWFQFSSQDKAKEFFYDICAELAYEGFSITKYGNDVSFNFEKKIPDGKKTLNPHFFVSLTNQYGIWNVWIHGTNYHY